MAVASPTRRHALLAPPWTPKRLPGLRAWLEADRSPRTLEAGMAAQLTRATSESLSRADNATLRGGDIDLIGGGWFYLDTNAADQGLMGKFLATGNQREYYLRFGSGANRLQIQICGDGAAGTITTVSAGTFGIPPTATWMFVLWWHDPVNNTINIKINDGTTDSTAHTTGVFGGTATFYLGALNSGTDDNFDGRQQCVFLCKPTVAVAGIIAALSTAMYNGGTPLSAERARAICGPGTTAGGVSYWECNEPSGTRVDSWGTNDLTDNNTVTTNPGTCLNAVGQINDLSGFGNNPVQATQANKPVLRGAPNGINGRPALRFDGMNDQLATAAFGAVLSQPFTIAHVVKLSATAAAQTFSDGVANKVIIGTDATPNYVLNASAGADTVAGTPNTSAHILVTTFDSTDRLYVDGAQVISADAGANTLDGLRIGATLGSANFLGGLWAGSVLCQGALTEQDRRWLERYWSRKYSIAVS